jgi:hypothetical protein
LAVVVSSVTTPNPADPDNIFIKNNTTTVANFTEYKILRAPLALDDVELGSIDDIIKYPSLPQVSTSKALQGTSIAKGSIVRLARKSDNSNEFYISEVLSNGGFVPGKGNSSGFGAGGGLPPTPQEAAKRFRVPPCEPPEIRSGTPPLNSPTPNTPAGNPDATGPTPKIPTPAPVPCPVLRSDVFNNTGLSERDQNRLRGVMPELAEAMAKLLPLLRQAGFEPDAYGGGADYITSAFRTLGEQNNMQEMGGAPAGSSPHNYGAAVDIGLKFSGRHMNGFRYGPGGQEVTDWSTFHAPKWAEVGAIIARSGLNLKWGGTFNINRYGKIQGDNVHIEIRDWRSNPNKLPAKE